MHGKMKQSAQYPYSVGYWINAEKREITEVEIDRTNSLAELQKYAGGPIQLCHQFPDGSVCFADEDGLGKDYKYAFKITGSRHEYFVGNGIIVGPEYPNSSKTRPPNFPLGYVKGIVEMGLLEKRENLQARPIKRHPMDEKDES